MNAKTSLRSWYRQGLTVLLLVTAIHCQPNNKTDTPESTTNPVRLVTLTPSATNLVKALDSTALLVGTDNHSNVSHDVVRVGSFLSPDVEAIIRLRPDLVIADAVQKERVKALRTRKTKVLITEMHNISDVRESLKQLGRELGSPLKAQTILETIDRKIAEQRQTPLKQKPAVLFVIDRTPGALSNLIVAGPDTFTDEILTILGAKNAAADAHTRYPKLSIEEVLRMRPDVILDGVASKVDVLELWKAIKVPATSTGRVFPSKRKVPFYPRARRRKGSRNDARFTGNPAGAKLVAERAKRRI